MPWKPGNLYINPGCKYIIDGIVYTISCLHMTYNKQEKDFDFIVFVSSDDEGIHCWTHTYTLDKFKELFKERDARWIKGD